MARKTRSKETPSQGMAQTRAITPTVMGRPTDYEPEHCQRLLDHMKNGMSFESFGGTINCARRTVYSWLEKYPEFLHAKEIGEQAILSLYEQILRNVAMGVVPTAGPGQIVTRGNATAAIFMAKVHGRRAGYNTDDTPFFNEAKEAQIVFEYTDKPAVDNSVVVVDSVPDSLQNVGKDG